MKSFITYIVCLGWCISSSATVLETLDLHSNYIGDDGAIIFADAINPNSTLKNLNLDDNQITGFGALRLGSLGNMSIKLPKIHIGGNIIAPDISLPMLMALHTPTMPSFSALGISMPHVNFQSILDMLRDSLHLTDIDFSGANIGDMGTIALAGMLKVNINIKSINLNTNGITDAGASALAAALAFIHTLESIDLTGNKFGPIGIMALKRLRLVNPNLKITFDGDLPDITMPDFTIPDFSLPGLPKLPGLPGMPDLSLNLPSWNLGKLNLGPGGGGLLIDFVIPHLSMPNLSLNDLHISGNMLGDMGAIKLLISLDLCPDLGALDLSDNKITFISIPYIKGFILSHPNLETLNLSLSMIGDLGISAIADTISQHPKLKTLILNETGCTNMGAAALGRALKTNVVLESLSLEGNFISDSGATALADGINANVALKSLNLGRNMIGPGGARSLASIFASGPISADPPADDTPPQPNIATLSAPSQGSFISGDVPLPFGDTSDPIPFGATDAPQAFTASADSTGSFMDSDGTAGGGQFVAAPGTSTLPDVDLSPSAQTVHNTFVQSSTSFIPPTKGLNDRATRAPSFVKPSDTGKFGSSGDNTMGMGGMPSASADNIEADNDNDLSDMGGFQ